MIVRPSQEVAREHADADAACGRAWVCQCGACREVRHSHGAPHTIDHMAKRDTRGRPPLSDDEETYVISLRVPASLHDRIAEHALSKDPPWTRKVRGEDAMGADMARAARELVERGLATKEQG